MACLGLDSAQPARRCESLDPPAPATRLRDTAHARPLVATSAAC